MVPRNLLSRGVHGHILCYTGRCKTNSVETIYIAEISRFFRPPNQPSFLFIPLKHRRELFLPHPSFAPHLPGRNFGAHLVLSLPCTLANQRSAYPAPSQLPSQPVHQESGLERRASNFQRHDLPSAPRPACLPAATLSTWDPCKTESLSLLFLLPCLPPADGVIRAVSPLPCSPLCDRNRLPPETIPQLHLRRHDLVPRSTSTANAATANTSSRTKTTTP